MGSAWNDSSSLEVMQDPDPEERDTIEKLKIAYMEDEGLPENLAEARAIADVSHLAGRSDDSFDARSGVGEKKGHFEDDTIEPTSGDVPPTPMPP
jgi:hypothetical protein